MQFNKVFEEQLGFSEPLTKESIKELQGKPWMGSELGEYQVGDKPVAFFEMTEDANSDDIVVVAKLTVERYGFLYEKDYSLVERGDSKRFPTIISNELRDILSK